MLKKVSIFVGLFLIVRGILSGYVVPIQVAPFAIFLILGGLTVFGKKNLNLWVITVCVTMALLNLTASWVDVAFWTFAAYAFYIKEPHS
jgi:hypothetical protein